MLTPIASLMQSSETTAVYLSYEHPFPRGDTVTVSAENDVHYDPYYVEINAAPYPMFRPFAKNRRSTTTSGTTSTR